MVTNGQSYSIYLSTRHSHRCAKSRTRVKVPKRQTSLRRLDILSLRHPTAARGAPPHRSLPAALITGTCDGLCVPISDTYGSRQNIQSTKCRYRKSISGSHRQQPLFVPHSSPLSRPSPSFTFLPSNRLLSFLSSLPFSSILAISLGPGRYLRRFAKTSFANRMEFFKGLRSSPSSGG